VSPKIARDSFGTAVFVRINESRFGSEVAIEGEIVLTGLFESKSWCNLLKSGKLETEVIALSVKSNDSS
jgi:hypothetical protein